MMEPDVVDAGAVILRDYHPVSADTYIGDVYAWLDQRIPAYWSRRSKASEPAVW